MSGEVRSKPIWMGSLRYAQKQSADPSTLAPVAEKLARQGHTLVAVGSGPTVHGFLALHEVPRPKACRTIRALRSLGIRQLLMLTGDHRTTAEAIARQIGLAEVLAELLPPEKVTCIERLAARGEVVAMVGDGREWRTLAPP